MRRTLLTLLSMTILTLTYGQEVKTDKEKFKIISADKMIQPSDKSSITLLASHVIVEDKLDIEADSILIGSNKKMLTAYGTKSFTFNGKVIVEKQNKGICKFHLGEDTLIIE